MDELVFMPLGLSNSVLPDRLGDGVHPEPSATPYAGPSCVEEFTSTGYDLVELNSDITEFSAGIVMAGTAGAIASTIRDLLAWAKSGTGDALLSPETVALRHNYCQIVPAGAAKYGLAQYMYLDEAINSTLFRLDMYEGWYGHAGDAFGFGTFRSSSAFF